VDVGIELHADRLNLLDAGRLTVTNMSRSSPAPKIAFIVMLGGIQRPLRLSKQQNLSNCPAPVPSLHKIAGRPLR
jgi:hypothetical protein